MDKATSLCTVISSVHGRLRRGQRNIGKRDLQAAVKHGRKEAAYPDRKTFEPRWKYTFADIVYITDPTSRQEITSYALPLPITKEPITMAMREEHHAAIARIHSRVEEVASHTVVVVDRSTSMKQADVPEFRSRIDAVYSTLALEFVETQLLNATAGARDIISLVEMGPVSEVIFEAQPMDWILFNRFLDLREQTRLRGPKGHGDYLPALQMAEALMSKFSHGNCALVLMFLSDGKPSDRVQSGPGNVEEKQVQMIHPFIERMTAQYGRRLTIHTIGFADKEQFQVLRMMADEANVMAKGCFHLGHQNLEAVFTTVASRLMTTKSEMTEIPGSGQRTVRSVIREGRDHLLPDRFSSLALEQDYDVFMYPQVRRQKFSESEKAWQEVPLVSEQAKGIAVRKKVFDEGAERFVRLMTEVDALKRAVGPRLVAKESRFEDTYLVENYNKHRRFHTIYVKTREKAAQIAERFNSQLHKLAAAGESTTANLSRPDDPVGAVETITVNRSAGPLRLTSSIIIEFLPCFLYEVTLDNGEKRTCSSEEMIDVRKYKKWNSNSGFVDGQANPSHPNLAFDLPVDDVLDVAAGGGRQEHLGAIQECETDEDSDLSDISSDALSGLDDEYPGQIADKSLAPKGKQPARQTDGSIKVAADPINFRADDVPQAFSHFSYVSSKRRMLVCDLQGVFDDSCSPQRFRFTDPVIHYHSNIKGRRNVFGKTDLGRKGMHKFFQTHRCNDLCRLLKLDRGFR